MNIKNEKQLYSIKIFLIIVSLLIGWGCAMDGVRYLPVVDENGNQLRDILTIPLYSTSFGIGVGPDGKGFHTKDRLIVTKPFIFHSGDDLMSKKISSRGVMIPPFVFIGSSSNVRRWLLVKNGFAPKLIEENDIYSGTSIVMTKGQNGKENDKIIDLLLTSKQNQNILKKLFGLDLDKDSISVILREKDIALLKSCKSGEF